MSRGSPPISHNPSGPGRGVHLAPVEIGRGYLRHVQIEWVDRKDISIEHDEIASLAVLETAGRALLLQRRRSIDGIGVDHILKGEALFGQKRRPAFALRP